MGSQQNRTKDQGEGQGQGQWNSEARGFPLDLFSIDLPDPPDPANAPDPVNAPDPAKAILSDLENGYIEEAVYNTFMGKDAWPANGPPELKQDVFYPPTGIIGYSTGYGSLNDDQHLLSNLDTNSSDFFLPSPNLFAFQSHPGPVPVQNSAPIQNPAPVQNNPLHTPDFMAAASLYNVALSGQNGLGQNQLEYPSGLQHQQAPLQPNFTPPNQPFTFAPHATSEAHSGQPTGWAHVETDVLFGFQQPQHVPVHRKPIPPTEVQYGSDPSFNNQSGVYHTPYQREVAGIEKQQQGMLGCLRVNESAATTRANSPVLGHSAPSVDNRITAYISESRPNVPSHDEDVPSRPPGSFGLETSPGDHGPDKTKEEVIEKEPKLKRRRPAGKSVYRLPSPGPHSSGSEARSRKRPKSDRRKGTGRPQTSNGDYPKAPRQNLTELQKKENHIHSERRRRTAIKDGYADLQRVVPDIAKVSKATVITTSAAWLEDLIKDNERLEKQLEEARRNKTETPKKRGG